MDKQEVYFYSAGHKLKGFWYPPKKKHGPKSPAVVCCHGFSAMIELQMVGIPEKLKIGRAHV